MFRIDMCSSLLKQQRRIWALGSAANTHIQNSEAGTRIMRIKEKRLSDAMLTMHAQDSVKKRLSQPKEKRMFMILFLFSL